MSQVFGANGQTSMTIRRRYGDAIAHSFGLTDVPIIRTRTLQHSQVAISRLSIGAQLEMTRRIPPEDTFILSMHLNSVPRHELWSRGKCVLRQGYLPSSIRIVNLTEEYSAYAPCPIETLAFYLPRAALDAFTEEEGVQRVGNLACPPGITDPVVKHLISALLPSFERPNEADRLFVDHLTLALLSRLSSRYGGPSRKAVCLKGAMTSLQERRAKEYMASHYDHEILLVDVARACGLSRGHFIEAFRVTTGVTPHRWLQRYRIDRAKSLLCSTAQPIAEIALACGFADQSHLTRVFSRLVGDSPATWRRRHYFERRARWS